MDFDSFVSFVLDLCEVSITTVLKTFRRKFRIDYGVRERTPRDVSVVDAAFDVLMERVLCVRAAVCEVEEALDRARDAGYVMNGAADSDDFFATDDSPYWGDDACRDALKQFWSVYQRRCYKSERGGLRGHNIHHGFLNEFGLTAEQERKKRSKLEKRRSEHFERMRMLDETRDALFRLESQAASLRYELLLHDKTFAHS